MLLLRLSVVWFFPDTFERFRAICTSKIDNFWAICLFGYLPWPLTRPFLWQLLWPIREDQNLFYQYHALADFLPHFGGLDIHLPAIHQGFSIYFPIFLGMTIQNSIENPAISQRRGPWHHYLHFCQASGPRWFHMVVFSGNPQLAGWFMYRKIPSTNGWFLGECPIFMEPKRIFHEIKHQFLGSHILGNPHMVVGIWQIFRKSLRSDETDHGMWPVNMIWVKKNICGRRNWYEQLKWNHHVLGCWLKLPDWFL